METRVGQQLGNYQLLQLLGRSSFAEVYLGEHRYLNTWAAIKVLQAHLTSEDSERLLTEARLLAPLAHPHLLRTLEFSVENDIPFLIMEYAPGGTLRQRYPKGTQLSLDTIVSYVKQLAEGLHYVHARGWVHRDIRPENMLFGSNNELLLTDFSVAVQSSRTQQAQEIVGTLAYMPPEQFQGHPIPASDQYALGIVVYEWLSGETPFHGGLQEIVNQHASVPPPSLHTRVPTIPPGVEQVVLRALAKDQQQRFASVQVFALALEKAFHIASRERAMKPVPIHNGARLASLSTREANKNTFGGLTTREREVAWLVAQGKANREIAQMLVVSHRTVERHIENILSKLYFTSRSQIAVWAIEKELGQKVQS